MVVLLVGCGSADTAGSPVNPDTALLADTALPADTAETPDTADTAPPDSGTQPTGCVDVPIDSVSASTGELLVADARIYAGGRPDGTGVQIHAAGDGWPLWRRVLAH